jgi:hypothetical protein
MGREALKALGRRWSRFVGERRWRENRVGHKAQVQSFQPQQEGS